MFDDGFLASFSQFNGQYFADSVPQRCNFCSSRADVDKLDKLLEGN